MKVSAAYNQNNPNFTSIRVVQTSSEQFVHFAKNFKDFYRNNTVFRAESFEQSLFFEHLKKLPQKEGASHKWVINNAVRHNLLSYDTIDNLPMCVFTGKDKIKLALYNIKNFIPNLIRAHKSAIKIVNKQFPEHLRLAKVLKESAEADMPKFKKFLQKNNAKYVTFDEFIKEIKEGKLNS